MKFDFFAIWWSYLVTCLRISEKKLSFFTFYKENSQFPLSWHLNFSFIAIQKEVKENYIYEWIIEIFSR